MKEGIPLFNSSFFSPKPDVYVSFMLSFLGTQKYLKDHRTRQGNLPINNDYH